MSEAGQKMAVVVIGLVATSAVIGWRVFAMRAELALGRGDGSGTHRHYPPKIDRVASPPAGVEPGAFLGAMDVEHLHASMLGTITAWHDAEELKRLDAKNADLLEVRRAELELGGNARVTRSLEPDDPDHPAGVGKLVLDIYFVSTGPLPTRLSARVDSFWPVVSEVMPGEAAEHGGLAVGDVILQVDGESPEASDPLRPCDWVTPTSLSKPANTQVKFLVSRGGTEQEIFLSKSKEKFGFECANVPYAGGR